jgi:DNA-binding SARP family transcriptional activator/tetratricopeptide (TPR) repeat protein
VSGIITGERLMLFRLLGPLEVVTDGQVLGIRSARQRTVLAMLLLDANRIVQLARIVGAIWDDTPPSTARGQVQTCVSALRDLLRAVGPDVSIVTSAAGYGIRLPETRLDVTEFRRLTGTGLAAAADGRTAEAVRDLRSALDLWRGPAAADVESKIVQAIAGRLGEDRLAVLEKCAELELSLGRHLDLVGELGELVDQHPLRERLRALHMLALYRSGRQSEALDCFATARQFLVDELGIEPGKELSELQTAILSSDPSLELAAPRHPQWGGRVAAVTAKQLPATIADFTGREQIVAELTQLLCPPAEGARGYVPVLVLAGKGGVGKTTLALHVAHAASRHFPDGQLFGQLRHGDNGTVSPHELLGGFLCALGTPAVSLASSTAERAATYRSVLADLRVLIVLDDMNDASQVVPLIPGGTGCAVIVTCRSYASGLAGARYFRVGDLDEDASIELVGKIVGAERLAAQGTQVRALVQLCGCLPLALRIIAAKLVERPHWTVGQMVSRISSEGKRLDELVLADAGIRATLQVSYRGLDRQAQALLALLGLVDAADFGSWVAGPLLDMDFEPASDLLDMLVNAHLVEVRVDESGQPRFRMHELVRIYARERLAAELSIAEREVALRRLLGCWLFLANEAHRGARGGDFAVLHGNAQVWRLPPQVVDELLSRPLDWLRSERSALVRAVLRAGRAGLDELCWDLAVTSVTLFELAGQSDDWRTTHQAALDATRRAGNERGEAAVLCSLGNLEIGLRMGEATRYLDPALAIFEKLGDTHGRALALSALASIDRVSGRSALARDRYQRALAGFRVVGDEIGKADVLANMAQIEMDCARFDEAEKLLGEALVISRAVRAPRAWAQAEYRLGELNLRTGAFERAERAFESALRIVREEGDLVGEAYALNGVAMARVKQGRYGLAEADLAAALVLTRRMTDNVVHGRVLLSSAELCIAQGDSRRALELLDEAHVIFTGIGFARAQRARVLELKATVYERDGRMSAADAARREARYTAEDLADVRSMAVRRSRAARRPWF